MKKTDLIEKIASLTVEAQDISHGLYQDLESLAEYYHSGDLSESETLEELEELREKLEEAAAE